MITALQASQLRKTYPPEKFKAISEALPEHRQAIIGQNRAVKALRFGLGSRAPGFNVYVATPNGDSKLSVIQHFLEGMAQQDPIPADWCYVNNFEDPYCPNALCLPHGKAKAFKADMVQFIDDARMALAKTLESEEYAQKQNTYKQELIKKQQQIFSEVSEMAKARNFTIRHTPMEIVAVPLAEGRPMTDEEFLALSQEEREAILKTRREIQAELQSAARKSRELEKKALKEMAELEKQAALFALKDLFEELMAAYGHIEEIPEYLEDLKKDILDNLYLFLQGEEEKASMEQVPIQQKPARQRYEVNVLVDHANARNAPIIVELNPTYNNLFGKIERESVMGTLVTNFTLIRPGALHRANGGYLILPIEELLRSPFSWDTLKRALRNLRIEIEDPTEKLGFITVKSLKPEPIPLNTQVVLMGNRYLFQLLYHHDEDFKKLFKVKADFDDVMLASEENIGEVCGLVYSICQEEKMLPVNEETLARIIEYSHRLAAHQDKVTAQLEEISDILREANFYAQEEKAELISARHIQQAIEEKQYRSGLIQEKVKELIADNTIMISLEGSKTGQINGLSVIDLGDFAFGRPSRITASISMGEGGIIDIEREANLGGPIHTKGVLTLSGFLFDKFGRDKPLALAIRLAFEQSYRGVEGDSASSAELYAILSRLAEVPIRQSIAVTGSVNQKGEIQAVGGINEKIEGFFEVCRQHGLSGEHGILIPKSNLHNLMLKEEVVQAVEKGQFHLWAIENVDEGIELLTGVKAGAMYWDEAEGTLGFEKGSVYEKANQRLEMMMEALKNFSARGEQLSPVAEVN